MRIIVGCPVKDRQWSLSAWHSAVMAQGLDVELLCLVSPSEDDTEALLGRLGVEVIMDEEGGRSINEIDGHQWGSLERYAYMARLRNRLLGIVRERRPDYFFSLDSDIILGEKVLPGLIEFAQTHRAHVVAPAVNMAISHQAWNTMNWGHALTAVRDYVPRDAGSVDVVMAAMLLDAQAIELGEWAAHEQGEDIGFCLNAERLRLVRWWVPDLHCTHLMQRSWL